MQFTKFFVKTLGCKVNQVETSFIIESLFKEGFTITEEESAQVFILNSCAVTHKAVQESKKIIKKWQKFNPSLIVLTGCYAQVYPQEILNWATKEKIENLIILGQKEKFKIPFFLKKFSSIKTPLVIVSPFKEFQKFEEFYIEEFFQHSRAFIKVQDGCDQFCSYCIVPYARGKPRSMPVKLVLKQIEKLIEKGYEEIVLTGIHLGKWGKDLIPPQKLANLLWEVEKFLTSFKKNFILRLSSIEVNEIDETFLNFAKYSQFLAPHFHLPLQSGSDRILQLMKRPYTSYFYLKILEKLYQLFPEATFGTDIIVGFPGETDEDFKQTLEIVENSPINWLHLFSFSPRPGTLAEKKFAQKVPTFVINERKRLLQELILKKRKVFLMKEKGEIRRAVVETLEGHNFLKGLTENYIEIKIKTNNVKPDLLKKVVKAQILEVKDYYLIGDLVQALTKSQL